MNWRAFGVTHRLRNTRVYSLLRTLGRILATKYRKERYYINFLGISPRTSGSDYSLVEIL